MDFVTKRERYKDERLFVDSHFHEYHCLDFQEETGQELELQKYKRCVCGRTREQHIGTRRLDSGSCGSISTGMKNKIKYVQLCDDDNINHLVQYMQNFWRMNKVGLVISVIGDTCPETSGLRRKFTSKLIEAARDTQGMIITSGIKDGVTKNVDVAFAKQGWYRHNQNIKVVGVLPWHYVEDKDQFKSPNSKKKRIKLKYEDVELKQGLKLCDSHTHFVLVDHQAYDKTSNQWHLSKQRVLEFRHKIENALSDKNQELYDGMSGSPVVIVLVGGGVSDLEHVHQSLQKEIPVIVCRDTGGLADILSHSDTATKRMMEWIHTQNVPTTSVEEIIDKITQAKRSKYLRVCDVAKETDFEQQIMNALMDTVPANAVDDRLCLAVDWGMLENIGVKKVLADKDLMSKITLQKSLMEAILKKDRLTWIEYYLDPENPLVDFTKFISTNLQILYKRATEQQLTPWEQVAKGRELDNLHVINSTLEVITDGAYVNDFNTSKKHFEYPYKQLLIWGILCHRHDIAKFALERCQEPLECAVAATRIHHYFSLKLSAGDELSILDKKRDFEDYAVSILQNCFEQDRVRAKALLYRKSRVWSNQTVLQMAANANDTRFMISPVVTKHMDEVWDGGIRASKKKKLLLIMFPFLILAFLDTKRSQYLTLVKNISEKAPTSIVLRMLQKIYLFYTAPVIKFSYHTLTYIAFLILFSYMALVDFRADYTTVVEYICGYWIQALLLDEFYTVIFFPSPSILVTIRNNYNLLRVLQLLNKILCMAAFYVHSVNGQYEFTKVMYALNLAGFYLELMQSFAANQELGPKGVMVRYMIVKHLSMFVFMMLLFMLAYGTSHQVLLYTQRKPSWDVLRQIFYNPYWIMYGELNLDDLESDDKCAEQDTRFCRKEHALVYVLMAVYLIMGNVLLLNLLIAIFNNVYTAIDDESLAIWRFNMYYLTLEYETKTVFVPPFSAVVQIYLLIVKLFKKMCKRCKDVQLSPIDDMRIFLDRMENDGRKSYFENKAKQTQLAIEERISHLESRIEIILSKIDKLNQHNPIQSNEDKQPEQISKVPLAYEYTSTNVLPPVDTVETQCYSSRNASVRSRFSVADSTVPPDNFSQTYNKDVDTTSKLSIGSISVGSNAKLNSHNEKSIESEEEVEKTAAKPRILNKYLEDLAKSITNANKAKDQGNSTAAEIGNTWRKLSKKKRAKLEALAANLDVSDEEKDEDYKIDRQTKRSRRRQGHPTDTDA